MKHFRFSAPIILLVIFLFSCSGSRTINLSIQKPSIIHLDRSIKTVALLNRAVAPPNRKNEIESVITGEAMQQDKQGRQHILEGLNYAFQQSSAYKGILLADELPGDGSGTIFPPALSWEVIEKICQENGTDAVIALETYDSDCIITHATGQITTTNAFGVSIPNIQYNATQKIVIKAGFRIYDLKNRRIVDEYTFSYWREWNANANNIGQAISGLINRGLAINQTCYDTGNDYSRRITPLWVNENRTIFTKHGNNPMAVGSRMALVGSWTEATTYWEQVLTTKNNKKTCGRAAYNLALASEVNGDLWKAKDWITKSYGIYNNKDAPYYQRTLNRRYNEMMLLNKQFASDTIH